MNLFFKLAVSVTAALTVVSFIPDPSMLQSIGVGFCVGLIVAKLLDIK